MKYVFFGTPEFAAIILEKLIKTGMPPVAVVCNPDKPVGRKKVITPPPTKVLATQNGIEVHQPASKAELLTLGQKLASEADFGVVAAYARIIPQEVIDVFKLGVIGVHPSLLPKYRGPSPIQSVILAGEEKTGTSLFAIDTGVDSGPILAQEEVAVEGKYYTELLRDLARVSAELLCKILPSFSRGEIDPTKQDDSQSTATGFFETDDGKIDEADLRAAMAGDETLAHEIERKVRALNPEPGVFTFLENKRTKLLRARLEEDKLILEEIQKEGKKPTRTS